MPTRQCPRCGAKVEVPPGRRPVCHACGHGAPPEATEGPAAAPADKAEPRQGQARGPIPPLAWVGIALGALAILVALVAALA